MSRHNPYPHADQVFEKVAFRDIGSAGDEFESCTFKSCDFSDSDLSDCCFTDCRLVDCSLSMATITNTGMRNMAFLGCKVVGVDFSKCRALLFAVSFEKCCLDYSGFSKTRLKKTTFNGCSIREADFTAADLTGTCFDDCDLERAVFSRTNLSQADFRTSRHYTINLEANLVRKAKFSVAGVAGLLSQYDIVIE